MKPKSNHLTYFTPTLGITRRVFKMSHSRKKIAVIGAGNVGATCAFVLAQKKLGDIVLLDIYEGFAKGKALDMSQNGQVLNYDGNLTGTSNYEDIAGADVVVVTSGFPRQPGMTREDLIAKNASIVQQVGEGIKEHAPESVIIMVTNPLDLMTYHMQKVTGFPSHRVCGQAGVLDSARMTHFVADAVGCSEEDVQAMVLVDMVILWCHFLALPQLEELQLHIYLTKTLLMQYVREPPLAEEKSSSCSREVQLSMLQVLRQQSWQKRY